MTTMNHTPGPWFASEDYYGGPSVRTIPEPNSNITGQDAIFENTGRGSGSPTQEDVALLALAPTAPHECVSECPGEINRRKLVAAELLMMTAKAYVKFLPFENREPSVNSEEWWTARHALGIAVAGYEGSN